ncbi:MAG: hypothetical protein HKN25_10630, partial [Pyrinomonadaceae bacterium]|nr:hypothetical protein [Pyrinomonadaceae bacterium]
MKLMKLLYILIAILGLSAFAMAGDGEFRNSSGNTIGYLKGESVRNSSGNTIGYFKSNGDVRDSSGNTIGRITSSGEIRG